MAWSRNVLSAMTMWDAMATTVLPVIAQHVQWCRLQAFFFSVSRPDWLATFKLSNQFEVVHPPFLIGHPKADFSADRVVLRSFQE